MNKKTKFEYFSKYDPFKQEKLFLLTSKPYFSNKHSKAKTSIMLKAIVNLLSYGQKRFLILITLSHIRKTISLEIYIFLSIATRHFLIHFRGRRRLLLFNGVLFLQEISNYIWIMT